MRLFDVQGERERDPGNPAPSKRPKLSLSRKGKGRFASVLQDDLMSMSKLQIPKNTEKSCKWALTNLTDWFEDYNARNPNNPCPGEILTCECSKEVLIKWLSVFVNETRSKNGDQYPPKNIQSLLGGILHSMRMENPKYPIFLDREDSSFTSFLLTLDNLFKSLLKAMTFNQTTQNSVD